MNLYHMLSFVLAFLEVFLLLLVLEILYLLLFGDETEPLMAIFKYKFLCLDYFCSGCSCHCVYFLFLADAAFV